MTIMRHERRDRKEKIDRKRQREEMGKEKMERVDRQKRDRKKDPRRTERLCELLMNTADTLIMNHTEP